MQQQHMSGDLGGAGWGVTMEVPMGHKALLGAPCRVPLEWHSLLGSICPSVFASRLI